MLSDTVNEVGTGLTMCHEISRISNTGVLAHVVAKCVSCRMKDAKYKSPGVKEESNKLFSQTCVDIHLYWI